MKTGTRARQKATGVKLAPLGHHDTIDDRRKRADEIMEANAELSPKQRLEVLDLRLGKDVGAVRERARLHQLFAGEMIDEQIASTK